MAAAGKDDSDEIEQQVVKFLKECTGLPQEQFDRRAKAVELAIKFLAVKAKMSGGGWGSELGGDE